MMMNSQGGCGIKHGFHMRSIGVGNLGCHRRYGNSVLPQGFDEQRQVGLASLGIDVPWVNTNG
jgi:hypothetical protein